MQSYDSRDDPSETGDETKAVLAIHTSTKLEDQNGRAPDRQFAMYVARAFRRLHIPYRVVYDLPTVDTPDGTRLEKLKDFAKQLPDLEYQAKDANLLLTCESGGGGWAYPYGNAGQIACGDLDSDYPIKDHVSRDDPRHSVFGGLHEIGHMMSQRPHGGHGFSWGRTWTVDENEEWHRTPRGNASKNDAGYRTNHCGEVCAPEPDGYERRDHLHFAECARNHMLIRGGPSDKNDSDE